MTGTTRHPIVVAGLGSDLRGDDGVGLAVVRALAGQAGIPATLCAPGDPTSLLDRWTGCELSVVVDATRSGTAPGTVHVVPLVPGDGSGSGQAAQVAQVARMASSASTHALGLASALALAEALGRLPRRVVLVGVEGECFEPGVGLTPAVADAVPEAVAQVRTLIQALLRVPVPAPGGEAPCA